MNSISRRHDGPAYMEELAKLWGPILSQIWVPDSLTAVPDSLTASLTDFYFTQIWSPEQNGLRAPFRRPGVLKQRLSSDRSSLLKLVSAR